ncbi:MAG TPA: hypothetical protein VF981_01060 [Gemmatimonadaceae bacterium]
MELKLKPYARLAAFGALGVAGGATGFYLFLVFFTRSVPLGGIDGTQAILTVVALSIPFALIIGAHLVYARVLFRYGRE